VLPGVGAEIVGEEGLIMLAQTSGGLLVTGEIS
jgi:hypothetical protein